jgi:hypothetical protein
LLFLGGADEGDQPMIGALSVSVGAGDDVKLFR